MHNIKFFVCPVSFLSLCHMVIRPYNVYTWCVQVLRSPKEAFAVVMQSWRERCEKCVCLQGDYVEKLLYFQLPVVSNFFNKLGDLRT